MMFKNIKKSDVLLIISIIIFVSFIAHFTFIAKNQFLRFIYPLEAQLSQNSVNCSDDAPMWMAQVLKETSIKYGSLSNQLVYFNQKGEIFHCENGWKKLAMFSQSLDQNTRFRYASLTKPITASVILKLNAEHKLRLSDKLVKYLPELKKFNDVRIQNITIENLLTHTSGFDRLKSNDPLFNTYEKPWCPYTLKKLENLKLDHQPGKKYTYDNRNYCFLSVIAERIEGMEFRQILNKKINLVKYNIKFIDGEFIADEVEYDFRYESLFTDNYINMFDFTALSPVAGLSGSASAYAELLSQLLMQKQSIQSLSSINTNCKMYELKSCFTLGLSQYKKNSNSIEVKWHDGRLPGANSLFIYDENGGITVWMGSGSPPEYSEEYAQFKMLYVFLNEYYRINKV